MIKQSSKYHNMNEFNFFEILRNKGIVYTEQQRAAVLHKDGPALVLAVPGSGKTTTIIGRIGNLIINNGVPARNILAITFSKSSAKDIGNRFRQLFGNLIEEDMKFSTIHAFANMVVNSYNKRFNKNLILLKTWQTNCMIEGIYKLVFTEELSEDKVESYVTGISYIKNKMLTINQIKEYEQKMDLHRLGMISNKYDELKKDGNYYDYDDMLQICLNILKDNKVTLDFLREKYRYILLDEGQDTSKLQFEIIKLLAYPLNNCFIVGDEDQTIYSFRGAAPELLLDFDNMFPNSKTYFMEQNFRSTKSIIDVANNVISKNTSRYDKNIFTEDTRKENGVDIVYLKDVVAQNKYLVNNLSGNNNEVALLYRTNLSAIPIANALNKGGISFYISNFKSTFFNHWITKDIMAIINLINNPSDAKALISIYYKIKTYMNKNMANKLALIDLEGIDVFDCILNNFQLKEYEYDRILTLKICFEEARKKSVSKGVKDILVQISYIEYLDKSADKSSTYNEIVSTIIDVLLEVESYNEANDKILSLRRIIEESSTKENSNITLSTFHGSKGLEFKEVYLLNGAESESLCDIKETTRKNKDDIESNIRLLYVGITRAKEKLKILMVGHTNLLLAMNYLEYVLKIKLQLKKLSHQRVNLIR